MKQTIKVSVADIRSFKKNSSHIKRNNILPILDFIKFDNGTITKSNINEFIVQESNFSGSFLIEERVLFNFIEYTNAAEIIFEADGNKIKLSDGVQKTTATQGDIALFPVTEKPPKETVSLTDTILKLFGAAAKYTIEEDHDLIISHIFIGGNAIMASDRFIGFFRTIDRELPKTAIPKHVAERVSSIDPADFSETENKLFPLENIDYLGQIERPYEWGYKIHLKSGSYTWVSRNDVRAYAEDDRKKLIEKLKNYIPKTPVTNY